MVNTETVLQNILDEVSAAQMRIDSVCSVALTNVEFKKDVEHNQSLAEDMQSINSRLNTIVEQVKMLAGESC